MSLDFDLVSDLHIDRWEDGQQIDWAAKKTSDTLIVAGDISDDLELTVAELRRMAAIYDQVVFIDGNHESHHVFDGLGEVPQKLDAMLADIPNVHYLRGGSFVQDGVAVVGACGWWDFKFAEPEVSEAESRAAYGTAKGLDEDGLNQIVTQAKRDHRHIVTEIDRLQDREDVEAIVVVTHTLPDPKLISWGVYPPKQQFAGCYGNSAMPSIRTLDRAEKVKLWAFGHNHDARDETVGHIRYLSNPRGRPLDFNREVYGPRRFAVDGDGVREITAKASAPAAKATSPASEVVSPAPRRRSPGLAS